MLVPKRMKYRKHFRDRGGLSGEARTGNQIAFGSFALKSTSAGEITSRQIESARQTISRYIKRGGKIWIRIFPHTPITRKAAEVPMGSGKGSVDFYVARILPGTILFELDGVTEVQAKEAFRLAGHKFSCSVKVVSKFDS